MRMLKIALFAVVSFLTLCSALPAKAAEVTIGILRFRHSAEVPESAATSVEQFVYSAFTSQQRFRVLERSRIDAVQAERAVQQSNEVVNPTALRDLGAQYVVLGEVTRAEVGRMSGSRGGAFYHATMAYGLRIIDVSTGAVSYSQEFSTGRGNPLAGMFSGFTGDVSTPAGAIDIALQQTRKDLVGLIGRAFSISGQIVSIESRDDKGVPRTVLVSLGVADGVGKKSVLDAYVSQTIDVGGKPLVRKKPVAELSFVEAQGDHLSLFGVRKGGGELGTVANGNATIQVEFKQ